MTSYHKGRLSKIDHVERSKKRSKTPMGKSEEELDALRRGIRTIWTEDEKEKLQHVGQDEIKVTRFVDRQLFQEMGILQDFDNTMEEIGISTFSTMDEPTYETLTLEFMATVELTFPPRAHKVAKNGTVMFKLGKKEYGLSLFEFCEIYGFEKNEGIKFPSLNEIDHVWEEIGGAGGYISHAAKSTLIWNPVLRLIHKVMGETIFSRREPSSVKKDEICLLFLGIKDNIRRPPHLSQPHTKHPDNLRDLTNYGAVLVTYLTKVRTFVKPYISMGGILTPIFRHVGINLNKINPVPKRRYIDIKYLTNSLVIKRNNWEHPPYLYEFVNTEGDTRWVELPFTMQAPTSQENIRFDITDEICGKDDDDVNEETEEHTTTEPLDPFNVTLPSFKFKPKSARDHELHNEFKKQRSVLGWTIKMIGALAKKLKRRKKEQPEVESSDEWPSPPQDFEQLTYNPRHSLHDFRRSSRNDEGASSSNPRHSTSN